MTFENDIFISYAHVDNQSLAAGQEGWISLLHERLRKRLHQLLGEEVKIWRDPRLQGNEEFSETLVIGVTRAGVLLPVLSPKYLKSDWCLRELETFCQAAEQDIGLTIDNQARVFKVVKTYIPRLRRFLAALVVAALLAVALAVIAFSAYSSANKERDKANKQTEIAEEQRQQADKAKQDALDQKTIAEQEKNKAETEKQRAEENQREAEEQTKIARQQTQVANTATEEAKKQQEYAESTAYIANMNLAWAEFERGNTPRGFELLDAYLTPMSAPPKQKDLRDFYWYHLWHQNAKLQATLKGHGSSVIKPAIHFPPTTNPIRPNCPKSSCRC